MAPSEQQLRARTLALAAGEASPTRRDRRRQAVVLVALAVAGMLAVFLGAGGVRPHERPLSLMVATVAGSAALAGLAFLLALGRGGSMLGRSRVLLLAGAALLPLALLLWKMGVSGLYQGMTAAWPEKPGLKCLGLELATGLLPLGLVLAARRRIDPVHPATTGAALGAACGLAAAALVDLWCPVADLKHLLLGHLLPIAVLASLGAALGRPLLGVHFQRRRPVSARGGAPSPEHR
jgi:hypothetical protein